MGRGVSMVAEEQHQGEGKTGPTQGAERGGGRAVQARKASGTGRHGAVDGSGD